MSSAFLLSLINDILDMSKIESGKMKIANREMNLKDAIRNIKVMIEAQAEERRQTFLVSVAPEVGEFYYCDSLRLNQILLNLLGNALKYTPEQGKYVCALRRGRWKRGSSSYGLLSVIRESVCRRSLWPGCLTPLNNRILEGAGYLKALGLGFLLAESWLNC